MGSLGFVSESLSKTGRSCGLRGTSLGSSKTLEAGVDTRLEEAEVGRLEEAEVGRLEEAEAGRLEEAEVGIIDRGELEEEAGSPTSGRYGL
jgi:hypothetical protein